MSIMELKVERSLVDPNLKYFYHQPYVKRVIHCIAFTRNGNPIASALFI